MVIFKWQDLEGNTGNDRKHCEEWSKEKMKYHLYDENYTHKGSFNSIQELRNFLCDRKYDISCDADMSCTFDYIKHIKWHWDMSEQ